MKIALQKRTVGEKFNRTMMMMMMISITLNDYLIIYNLINKMKFGMQFEFHKIPEWYADYFDYMKFKLLISTFKKKVKCKLKNIIL